MKREARKIQRIFGRLGLQLVSDQGVTLPYITPKQVAELLCVTAHELKKWREACLGPPYYHVEDSVRYPVAGFKVWLKKGYLKELWDRC